MSRAGALPHAPVYRGAQVAAELRAAAIGREADQGGPPSPNAAWTSPRIRIIVRSWFVLEAENGSRDGDRVDGRDLEPGHGLHEDKRWLRSLLRRAVFRTLPRHTTSSFRDGLRFDPAPRPP